MELWRSKQRILEVYLNIVEFGDWIYGIDQAAHYYFDTSADKLTKSEATLLAAILPNPRYYQDHLRSYVLTKRKSAITSGINKLKAAKAEKAEKAKAAKAAKAEKAEKAKAEKAEKAKTE